MAEDLAAIQLSELAFVGGMDAEPGAGHGEQIAEKPNVGIEGLGLLQEKLDVENPLRAEIFGLNGDDHGIRSKKRCPRADAKVGRAVDKDVIECVPDFLKPASKGEFVLGEFLRFGKVVFAETRRGGCNVQSAKGGVLDQCFGVGFAVVGEECCESLGFRKRNGAFYAKKTLGKGCLRIGVDK